MCLVKVLSPIRIGFLALMASAGHASVLFYGNQFGCFIITSSESEIRSSLESKHSEPAMDVFLETLKEVGMDDTDLKVFYPGSATMNTSCGSAQR